MIDLKDLTFLIPFRYDSFDRLNNLNLVLNYLKCNFICNILVGEEYSVNPTCTDLPKGCQWYGYTTKSEYFQKCKTMNNLFKESNTKYICLYDSDVFLPKLQYLDAYNLLNGDVDIVLPYDGTVYNIPRSDYIKILDACLDPKLFLKIDNSKYKTRRKNSIGGAIFFKSNTFRSGGMANENFKSWGAEDDELFYRFAKLEYKMRRVNGPMYHLDHFRSTNGRIRNPNYKNNMNEYNRIRDMSSEQLKLEIQNWTWIK